MTLFFRLLKPNDKGTALQQAIQQLAEKQPNTNTFAVEPESFQQVPGAPFAYWVDNIVREAFQRLGSLESPQVHACKGPDTGDDFRFMCLWWETPFGEIDVAASKRGRVFPLLL